MDSLRWMALISMSFATLGARSGARSEFDVGLAPIQEIRARVWVELEGFVLEPDGTPAVGALVLSSAGGEAVTDSSGWYRLTVPPTSSSVRVTAVGRGGQDRMASTSVELNATGENARVGILRLVQGGSCEPGWLPTFGGAPGLNGAVYSLAVYDDGGGPALYAGGSFSIAGGIAANRLAKWDGTSWSALGSGIGGVAAVIQALAVYDDGTGPALYAGGEFSSAGGVATQDIARWNGVSWSALGSGTGGVGSVRALTVFDNGFGPALYVGGTFSVAGGLTVHNIARWKGSTWSALGSGTNSAVYALAVFDRGSGPSLYAGGEFSTAGGVPAIRIAKWDGSIWSALGSGVSGSVLALAVYDQGSGPSLYAGGNFTSAGTVTTDSIARWNGTNWFPVGSGGGMGGQVEALSVYDDGSGPALYAGGYFTSAGGVPANRIAKWNGASWAALGAGVVVVDYPPDSAVLALAAYDDGGGSALFAGGRFTSAGGVNTNGIAKWTGASWGAPPGGMSDLVATLAVYDDGSGPALHAGGEFTTVNGVSVNYIAKWNGTSWEPLGSGMGRYVRALTVYDDGGGTALYAGGEFITAGGVAANRIAKWDGASWTPLGSGLSSFVNALAVYDDGSGPALFAGGEFTTAGGVAASYIAKWNGTSWAPLGSGVNTGVHALATYDDGSGPALYAGGRFFIAGGAAANRIAKWNGASWAPLGSGVSPGSQSPLVAALAVYDDGGGPALYAGGQFATAGGVPAGMIAKWDGATWSALGSGMVGGSGFPRGDVFALTVYDDGDGAQLYAGGYFTSAGGVPANHVAKWNGSVWAPLGSGVTGSSTSTVSALTVFDDGSGPTLYAAGDFASALDSGDSYVARWGLLPDTTAPALSCPSSILFVSDLPGSPPGEFVTLPVTAADCRDPSPSVVCVPPSGSFFLPGATLVTCTATDASGNQSTCEFQVVVGRGVRKP